MDINIVAVIVTYNRLELLIEAVNAVRSQSFSARHIIVVDNDSNDGTKEWLSKQDDLLVEFQSNSGGSGGFYTGLKLAQQYSPDWVWVMDDDTICNKDTLAKLVEKIHITAPIGFVGSKSVWSDGSPHLMNLPAISPSVNGRIPFNKFDDRQVLLTETASFVSLLINNKAILEIGLPYKEFFIWGDDQEYTKRITKTGYLGFYCMDSVVLHKTGVNYFPDFYNDVTSNLWKHGYGFRNEFFMVRKNKGSLYYTAWLPVKVAYTSLKLCRIRKNDRLTFIRLLINSAWKSIFFNPKINQLK